MVSRKKFRYREQGWGSGDGTGFSPMWPRFKSHRRCHMWVEFVIGSPPCSERFFFGYSVFPISSIINTFKFKFDLEGTDMFKRVLKKLLGDSSINKLQFATNLKLIFILVVPTGLDESWTWPFFIAVNITSSALPTFAWGSGFYCGKRENTATEKLPGINVRKEKSWPIYYESNNEWPISAHTQGAQSSFDISHTTISQSNTSYLVYMFADFLMVFISDNSLKLHQSLGTSCDVTAGYLRNNVIEGSCWVGPAKHPHVRRSWISDEEKRRKTSSLFQFS